MTQILGTGAPHAQQVQRKIQTKEKKEVMFFSVVQQDKISLLQTIQYFLPYGHKPFQVVL